MEKESTYSKFWDHYIEDDLHTARAERDDLEWPGDEWGTQEQWENIYQLMFVRTGGVERWSRTVEIGQGSGKYTLKVLANPQVTVRAYDVSARFLDVCRERCAAEVEAGRLSLHRIDPTTPRYLLSDLTEAGWRRQVDAVYSIEAMVHVDLQYLMAYLLTAAAVLKPGGKLILTLATVNSDHGFEKLLSDVRNQWRSQTDPAGSDKYEWLNAGMVESILPRLGFEVDHIWEPRVGISLGVVASLRRPEVGDQLERYLT